MSSDPAFAADYWIYFGTGSDAIYRSSFDSQTGETSDPVRAAEIARPNFLAVHPNSDFLYAAARRSANGPDIAVAYSIDRSTGDLTELNRLDTRGPGTCHVNVDASGRTLALANYRGGSVESMRLSSDGSLAGPASFFQHRGSSINPRRQSEAHAHSVNFTPDNRILVVADLGMDKLMLYRVKPDSAELSPHSPTHVAIEAGSGPRHFSFHPDGKQAYVINELASTITVLQYDADQGSLSPVQTVSTLPDGFSGTNTTAEVVVHPSGRFVYGSNRGHDSIAVFVVDPGDGTLKPVQRASTLGNTPRNFRLDPTGSFLFAANQQSGNVVVFRLRTGNSAEPQ